MKYGKQNIIYHYCSLEAFHSIITTRSFWLFSLSSSNDPKEMTEAEEVIDEILNEEKYENINKPSVLTHEFYSLSCTKKRDNALHFCKYADNEKGVCIGIDTMVFKKYLEKTMSLDLYSDYLSFEAVIYKDEHGKDRIRKYLDHKLLCIEQPEKNEKKFLKVLWSIASEQQRKGFIEQVPTETLSHFKPILKIKNYKDESEVRIFFDRNQFQSNKDMLRNNFDANDPIIKKLLEIPFGRAFDTCEKSKILEFLFAYLHKTLFESAEKLNMNSSPMFKVMSGVIRKYMKLKMKDIWYRQPIKEVILGPNCKTNLKEFNEFLTKNKVLCEAVESEINKRDKPDKPHISNGSKSETQTEKGGSK